MINSQYSPASYRPTVTQELVRWGYSLLLLLIVPFSLLILFYKVCARTQSYGDRIWERYGFLPKPENTGGILLHCVSVGEVVAAATLVKTIRAIDPNQTFTITTTTPTGGERVRSIFGDEVNHLYLPYDVPVAMENLFSKVKPEKVLITEVELWPNLIHLAWKRDIPIYIVNARMTDRSYRSYTKLSALFYPMLHKITAICAQGQRDYDNYQKLGADHSQLILTNNIKFDQKLSSDELALIDTLTGQLNIGNRKVLIGGSTHDPEELVLIDAYKNLKQTHPNLLLILVPRHPQRFERVEQTLAKRKLSYIKLSSNQAINTNTDIVLADKMGVLKSLYGIADFAFVGGSIADKGGHNALEPAMHGIPVIMGNNIYNNPAICNALAESGALKFALDSTQIAQHLTDWLENENSAKAAGTAGRNVVINNAGAIEKTIQVLDLKSS